MEALVKKSKGHASATGGVVHDGFLQFSIWIYQKLLFLYPEDLRRDFGGEIVLAFADDLEETGVIRVWWCALARVADWWRCPANDRIHIFLSPALSSHSPR